jgi:hypothetical protein
MNKELYGKHKEFTEVNMKLEKIVETDFVEKWEKSVDKAAAKAAAKTVEKAVEKAAIETAKAAANAFAKAQAQSSIQFAKAMKSGGEAIDKIIRYTGLSRSKIMAL